jgi:hypothetical protein
MRPRATEIRAVTALLDQEWEDVEALANAVIETVHESLMSREWWTVIATDKRLGTFVYGPYETRNKATKAIGKEIVSPGPEPMQAMITKLIRGSDD